MVHFSAVLIATRPLKLTSNHLLKLAPDQGGNALKSFLKKVELYVGYWLTW